jgi:glycosyltransferase involved in cell wall biosynthesis
MRDGPLRVHVLIDSLTWGGAETLLADFAIGARGAGIELSVGYLNERFAAGDRLREQGIEPVLVPIKSLLWSADRRLVRAHIAEVDPDLVHTHLGYSDLHGGIAARALGIPTVATLHVMHWERTIRERTKARIMGFARRHCAARVIAVSEAVRSHYLETGWDRPERVVTVHNGIVGEPCRGAGAGIRAQLGLSPDDLVLVMLGVLRRGKGHDVAAEAVEELSDRFPRLRLVVLGEGRDRSAVEPAVHPLGARAVLTGHRDDVMAVLDAADVLLHPSSVDAFPTALLEAAAAGVPAVATAIGGIPEIVDDGETGFLIDPPPTAPRLAATLLPLLRDAELRRTLGERARRRFEAEFTVGRWLERLWPVYELALRSRPARRTSPRVSPHPPAGTRH